MVARGVHPGSQSRSRAAFERILAAAEQLLDGRDWQAITVEDICLLAEVSPSSFYRRFASKDALLGEIHDRWLEGREAAARALVEYVDWQGLSRDDLMRLIAELHLADRDNNAARALSMFRVQVTHPQLSEARARSDQRNLELVSPLLARAIGADLERTKFGLLLLSAGLIAAVQPPVPYVELLGWPKSMLVDHACAAFCGATGLEWAPDQKRE